MANKVALTYEDGKYIVSMDGSEINTHSDAEKAFENFKQVVKNNAGVNEKSWEFIKKSISESDNKNIEFNDNFKTVTAGALKYFYNTGKVFYISESNMTQLIGGFELIDFILKTPALNDKEEMDSFLDLCRAAIENKANYRAADGSIIVFSAALNYGTVEYNFNTKRVYKGVAVESGSFEEFKEYVLSRI